MPASVIRLAGLAIDEESAIRDLIDVIKYDEALTTNLIRVANSVWGGSKVPICTINDAVVRLGKRYILHFAVGAQIAAPMSTKIPGYQLGEHELWRHSLICALMAEQFNAYIKNTVSNLSYTAALIHDIGKVLLGRHIDAEILERIRLAMSEANLSFQEAENEVLGTNHAEVGGSIARHWQFPEPLIDAIELHHEPEKKPGALMDVVYLANILAKRLCSGMSSTSKLAELDTPSTQRLGLDAVAMETVSKKVITRLAEVEKVFSHITCRAK